MATTRTLSYSEIQTALTCMARHAFAYTGHLTGGDTLKPRSIAPILSEGRAWGAAVAAWHADREHRLMRATAALHASLIADADQMIEAGLPVDLDGLVEMEQRLAIMLGHYCATSVPFSNLTRLEDEVDVPIPSRGGRVSNRYRFLARIDGYTVDDEGRQWIVEFKLRGRLQPFSLIERQRQIRWYAWALSRCQRGYGPDGVIVEERLNAIPHEPNLVKARRKGEGIEGRVPSHAVDQLTTAAEYVAVCERYGVEPMPETMTALEARVWQQRHAPLRLRPSELAEAGRELVSAAKLIRDLDSGELAPIRNATSSNCGRCQFREICAEPSDHLFVDSLFVRRPPKRVRALEAVA